MGSSSHGCTNSSRIARAWASCTSALLSRAIVLGLEPLDCEQLPQLFQEFLQKHIRFNYLNDEIRTRAANSYIKRLDASKSMKVADIVPDRLDAAKLEIHKLLEGMHGGRVGLVPFAGLAFIQTPLTSDFDVIGTYLDDLRVEDMPRGGTAIGRALIEAIRSLVPPDALEGTLAESADTAASADRDTEAAERRREAAQKLERERLTKRQERRAEKETRSDEQKRPKGIIGFVFKLIGKAAKIEKQISQAQQRRAERDAAEWVRLEARQNEQRASLARSYSFMHDMERKEFRAEAKRLHAEITSGKSIREARKNRPERSPGRSLTPRRYRDDDDDGRGRGGNGRDKRLGR